MRVLVTGAGAVLGQGIIRSLLASPLKPHVIAADPNEGSAGLYWVTERHLIPMATEPHYVAAIDELLRRTKPDAVMLGTDVELGVFAAHRAQFERDHGTKIVVSSSEVIKIADDKYSTFQFLRRHKLDAPESCLPGEEAALIAMVGFPLVVKPRVGARSVGLSVVHNASELARALTAADGLVIQECVGTAADEYTAGALCFEGKCEASIVMRRDLRDGNTYRAYVAAYPELNRFIRHVTELLQPYGPVNFQFRLANDRPKIFEINGRFSGTTPFRMRAGFNEVEMVLRHVLFGEPVKQPPVQPMTILRHFEETVVLPDEEIK